MTTPSQHLDLDHFLPYRLSVLTNRISQGLAYSYRNHCFWGSVWNV